MIDRMVYEAALEGLLLQRQRVDDQIQQVKSLLGKKEDKKPTKKRVLSEAARKRIAAAQKKRWAEYHAKNQTD